MLLNLPVILSRNSFKSTYCSQIFSHKIHLLTKIHANLLINIKKVIYILVTTLNRHEMLSTAKYFPNCGHRNEKYLIVGLSLNK